MARKKVMKMSKVIMIFITVIFALFWLYLIFVSPSMIESLNLYLNDSIQGPDALAYLDGTRVFAAFTVGMAAINLFKLTWSHPSKSRSWLFLYPVLWFFSYYLIQLIGTASEVTPRHGFFLNNLAFGAVFAGVGILAAQIKYICDKEAS